MRLSSDHAARGEARHHGYRLSDPAADATAVQQEFFAWMRPLHQRVVRELDDAGRSLLVRCANGGVQRAGLSDGERTAILRWIDEGWLRSRKTATW